MQPDPPYRQKPINPPSPSLSPPSPVCRDSATRIDIIDGLNLTRDLEVVDRFIAHIDNSREISGELHLLAKGTVSPEYEAIHQMERPKANELQTPFLPAKEAAASAIRKLGLAFDAPEQRRDHLTENRQAAFAFINQIGKTDTGLEQKHAGWIAKPVTEMIADMRCAAGLLKDMVEQ